MKILHTADWHIGNFAGPEKDGVNLRSLDFGNIINQLQLVAMSEKPDLIVVAGDIFHQARVWADRGLSETKVAIRAIEALSEIAPIVVLRGTPNHDGSEQFAMLQKHFEKDDSVSIITNPSMELVEVGDEYLQVVCLPGFDRGTYRARFPGLSREEENIAFTEELGNIMLGLRGVCQPDIPAVFVTHYTVPGCNTESGQVQFFSKQEPVLLPETLDAADFDLVMLGHIHRPQKVMSCRNTFYSGALNAMNFNDEGQERGFYMHDMEQEKSRFFQMTSREFKTIRMTDEAVSVINSGFADSNYMHKVIYGNDTLQDKIVRVLYSCTDENAKTLNKNVLEQQLYLDGAFWVSEISPEKIDISVNRSSLEDKNDPIKSLVEYLETKAVPNDKIGEIVNVATPIVAEVLATVRLSRLVGIFEPVEIAVKNYRNYAEETFNFSDITFCTINGKNGAGKSSLFMDAILDCLYEEPREGDLTGWIRADESARSGSITFTFRIGEKTFRVTRTRAKSGKATLNISEFDGNEWCNCSMERMKDTQEIITDIVGMDSLTFRSCALIMQDQYGLFLQADKEKRVAILSNILGLGMYENMQNETRQRLTNTNREIANLSAQQELLQEKLSALGATEEDLANCERNIEVAEADVETWSQRRDEEMMKIAEIRKAQAREMELRQELEKSTQKQNELYEKIEEQDRIAQECEKVLAQKEEILAGANRYRDLEIAIRENLTIADEIEANQKESKQVEHSLGVAICGAKSGEQEIEKITAEIAMVEKKLCRQPQIEIELQGIQNDKNLLEELLQGKAQKEALEKEEHAAYLLLNKAESELDTFSLRRKLEVKELQKKAEILENSNCVDLENANCRFLIEAKEAVALLPAVEAKNKHEVDLETEKVDKLLAACKEIANKLQEFDGIEVACKNQEAIVRQYEPLIREHQELPMWKSRHTELVQMEQSVTGLKNEWQSQVDTLTKRKKELQEQEKAQTEIADNFWEIVAEQAGYKKFAELEKELPLAESKKEIAEKRKYELAVERSELCIESVKKSEEQKMLMHLVFGLEQERELLMQIESALKEVQFGLGLWREKRGALIGKVAEMKHYKEHGRKIAKQMDELSKKAVILDILKQAFSPDGVPHNIIRTMLPTITATANAILGQMTGGKMGMEFRTEKVLKSNSKKEVVTLDIYIEEYGKPALPYSSKSGGEKVKAALSAILALAEMKSMSAGIRLGMLFIDEPPFLDGDGIQAYCDALETIGQRYHDIKIMAITHDPTMKARFPQNLDVVKTEMGSKVIFE